MKLVTLALLAFFVVLEQTGAQSTALAPQTPGIPQRSGQTEQMEISARNLVDRLQNGQSGCPVVFTNVALKRNTHYLPVTQPISSGGNLDFQYKNITGKQIQSISIQVEVRAKKSLYDLDAAAITADMVLTGNSTEVALPPLGFVYGIDHLTLERVRYTDGTVWDTPQKSACHYGLPGGAEQIGKLW